jgi:transcriptional regulator with XRE-family HTH domain
MILGYSTCRAARGLLDWTQTQLAERAGVGLSTVKNFEAGRSFPSTDNLLTLQRVLAAAQIEFLPGGAVRLWPDPITFGPDHLVDRYRFRLIAYRQDREIAVDISREAVDDADQLIGASLAVRHARFQAQRAEFEACAEDVLRGQAPTIGRITIDSETFDDWRRRHRQLVARDK